MGPPESITQTAAPSIQPFLYSSRQCRLACPGMSFSLKMSLRTGYLYPFICKPTRILNPSGILIGSQLTAGRPYRPTLQWAVIFPSKFTPSHDGIWTACNTRFLGPTRVQSPICISIGSAVLQEVTAVTHRSTDEQTDRPRYSVCITIGRIYVRSTAMRPNNNELAATLRGSQSGCNPHRSL